MARTTTRNAIVVQSAQRLGVTRLEAVGSAVLLPGWLAEIKGAGDKLGKHATASGATAKLVVLENPTPDTITYPTTAAIDIRYASGDTIYFCQAQPGDLLNMWLKVGTCVKGQTWVISDGSGHVTPCGTGVNVGTSNPVGVAWEDKAAGGTATRMLVRIV